MRFFLNRIYSIWKCDFRALFVKSTDPEISPFEVTKQNLEITDFWEKMRVEISKWYQKSLETSEIKFLGQVVIA